MPNPKSNLIMHCMYACMGLVRFEAEMLLACVLFPFSKKISPLPFIRLPVDVHHSLHINHQSVAPFSPPPGLNLFTFLSFLSFTVNHA